MTPDDINDTLRVYAKPNSPAAMRVAQRVRYPTPVAHAIATMRQPIAARRAFGMASRRPPLIDLNETGRTINPLQTAAMDAVRNVTALPKYGGPRSRLAELMSTPPSQTASTRTYDPERPALAENYTVVQTRAFAAMVELPGRVDSMTTLLAAVRTLLEQQAEFNDRAEERAVAAEQMAIAAEARAIAAEEGQRAAEARGEARARRGERRERIAVLAAVVAIVTPGTLAAWATGALHGMLGIL